MDNKLNASDLAQFTGSETWYKHMTGGLFTEGVKYLADHAGAYWLIDEIMFRQRFRRVRQEEFQLWKLTVIGSEAVLDCEDGNGHIVHTKRIEFTDFPLPEIRLWFTDHTLLLPSEY